MKQFLIIALMVLSPFWTAGQGTDNVWTLQKCVDYAIEHNLTIQRNQLGVALNEVNLNQSKMAMLPNLNGGASFGVNWGRNVDPTSYQFITERLENSNLNLSSSVILYNGGRVRNTIKQSQKNYEQSKFDLEKVKNDMVLSVVVYYTNVIFNNELYENAKKQLNSTQQQVSTTRSRVDAGVFPQSTLLDLLAQLATNEVNVINAENNWNFSVLQLKQSLQLPASSDLVVEIPDIELDEGDLAGIVADNVFSIAVNNMPEVKSAELGIGSSMLGLKIAQSGYLPRLNLNAGLSTNYSSFAADRGRFIADGGVPIMVNAPVGVVNISGTDYQVYDPVEIPSGTFTSDYPAMDQFNDNLGEYVSLGLSIPIFNGLQANSAVQRARIGINQAEITALETKQMLRQNIESAYNDVIAATKSYSSSQKQVEAQEESFRATKQRYDNGVMNFVDYQIAENNLFQSRSDLLRAKYDYIFKLKVLDFYQGKTLEF